VCELLMISLVCCMRNLSRPNLEYAAIRRTRAPAGRRAGRRVGRRTGRSAGRPAGTLDLGGGGKGHEEPAVAQIGRMSRRIRSKISLAEFKTRTYSGPTHRCVGGPMASSAGQSASRRIDGSTSSPIGASGLGGGRSGPLRICCRPNRDDVLS
jgi:hypothetical protein